MPLEPEELIGKLWHRLITRVADRQHAAAAVTLDAMRTRVCVMFRALGGDGGLRVEAATASEHGARRRWLERIAGSGQSAELAWRDDETLRLPPRIALFPTPELNRDLFLWLAAMAALDDPAQRDLPAAWMPRNQLLTQRVLARFPGLVARYRRLVEAQCRLRPDPHQLPHDEAAAEQAIRTALHTPGSVAQLPLAKRAPQPVWLWLHPSPPLAVASPRVGDEPDALPASQEQPTEQQRRRRGERVDMPHKKGGLLALRMENIFTIGEFARIDRETDDDDDDAGRHLQDMDTVSVARDRRSIASRLRFDLDLPAAACDDLPLGEGILLPEWDFRRNELRRDFCRLQPMLARDIEPVALPRHLRRTAHRLRGQFEALVQSRAWYRGQSDGSEVDLAAYLDFAADRHTGHASPEQGLYRDFRRGNRDLACLLLADLSLSTDAAVNNDAKVIDVIRDALFLFSEAMAATGDRFAMYGFSSRRREHVRMHLLKEFTEQHSAEVRGRIRAIRPGYYTRMGAAIRHATNLLVPQTAARQLLLILTDGKPNDLDHYEGRYGVEDTCHALHEARSRGLYPFCVTIDRQAGEYLPHLFGPGNYVVIRRPEELPRQLPLLYARLTA